MAEIKKLITDDIVKDIYNSTVEALLQTLQITGSLKETIIEAKHLTENINAVAKGFNADKVDGLHASDFMTTSFWSRGDPNSYDVLLSRALTDNTWRTMNLGVILPTGIKTALLQVNVYDDSIYSKIEFRKIGNENDLNVATARTLIVGQMNYYSLIVDCSPNRWVEYRATDTQWNQIGIVIRGGWY